MDECFELPLRSGFWGSSEAIRPPSLESTQRIFYAKKKNRRSLSLCSVEQGCVSHCAPLSLPGGRGQAWAKASGDGVSWQRAGKGEPPPGPTAPVTEPPETLGSPRFPPPHTHLRPSSLLTQLPPPSPAVPPHKLSSPAAPPPSPLSQLSGFCSSHLRTAPLPSPSSLPPPPPPISISAVWAAGCRGCRSPRGHRHLPQPASPLSPTPPSPPPPPPPWRTKPGEAPFSGGPAGSRRSSEVR